MIERIKWRTFWLIFPSWFTCFFVFSPLALAVLPDIYEEDDTYLLADVIGLNYDTQRHNFHDPGDQDWVKFYGVAGEIYEIKVSNVGADCDPVIELYDSDGETLLQGPWDWWGYGEQELMDWDCSRDGVYYVMIRHSDPSVFGDATGYDLDVYRPIGVLTGFIAGSVVCASSGSPIVGAQILSDRGDSAVSLPDGSYLLLEKAGTSTLTASAIGYDSISYPGVVVPEAGTVKQDLELVPTNGSGTSIDPASMSFDSSGGTGSVSVTAPGGLSWTATSNSSWITITSGASGLGNGTVNYSVSSNSSESPRTGTITIAGNTFTVNQTGVSESGLWSGATDLGDGWKHLDWFGLFWVDETSPWIYHYEHGWVYAYGEETSSIWFYTSVMGWFWTSDTVYPWIYVLKGGVWTWDVWD